MSNDHVLQGASRRPHRTPQMMFWLFLGYMFLEYVRPPLLAELRLQLVFVVVVPLVWLNGPRLWSSILSAQLAFLLWCAKGIPIAANYYAAYMVTRNMYAHFAIALAVTWIGSNLQGFRRIVWIWFGIIVYSAAYSISHAGVGLGGFMEDENDLALAAVTALPLPIMGMQFLAGRGRVLCVGAGVLLLTAVVTSFSRGGFVGLIAAVGYCFIASPRKLRIGAVLVTGLAIMLAMAPAAYIDEIKSIAETNEGTARGRKFLWTAAFNMWKERPVLGWGGGNTNFLIGRFQPDWEGADYQEKDWTGAAVHSLYFQLLPEHGLGTLIFALLGFLQFRSMHHLRRDVRRARDVPLAVRRDTELFSRALNGMLVGYLASGAFISVAYYPYFWYITALAAALDIAVRGALRARRPKQPPARIKPGAIKT